MAGLWEIAIGAILHGVGITVAELVLHGVVAALCALVRLLRTLSAVGIVQKMVAGTFQHGKPFEARVSIKNEYRVRLRRKLGGGNVGLHVCLHASC